MKLQTFQFSRNAWSVSQFPELDSENTLVLIFAAPEFIDHPEPLKQLFAFYPNSKVIGCSSAGEINGASVSDKSISVAVTKFEKTTIKSSIIQIKSPGDSYNAGKKMFEQLNKTDLRSIFVLSDGLHINGSELVRGLNDFHNKDNKEVIITGGLAGDGKDFKQTWTVYNGEIVTDSLVGIGFYGNDVHIGHGSQGGWDIFGPERRITASRNNVLYKLDNKPALALYKEYLGNKANDLPASGLLFPLAIRKDKDDDKHLVRTILGVNEKEQSLIFAGDIPQGYLAQLMRANFDRLVSGASQAGKALIQNADYLLHDNVSPTLLIAISCVGRRLLLGERIEEEVESTLVQFPKGTKQVGFYSYGELSPFANGDCDFHNQTMTLTSICENEAEL